MAELTKVAAEAMAAGRDGMRAVQAAFPGIPIEVAVEAEMNVNDAATKAWWQQIERTIDGEIIRQALAGSNDSEPPA